jgi:hypothetical protein
MNTQVLGNKKRIHLDTLLQHQGMKNKSQVRECKEQVQEECKEQEQGECKEQEQGECKEQE